MQVTPLSFSIVLIDPCNLLEFRPFGFQIPAAVCGIGILGFQFSVGFQAGDIQRFGGNGALAVPHPQLAHTGRINHKSAASMRMALFNYILYGILISAAFHK